MSAQIHVDCEKKLGPYPHSWTYIGYDECNYTYIPEGLALLKKFAELGDGPYYFRTHFMFCTGNCHGTYKFGSTNLYSENRAGEPVYNFTWYDKVIDAYRAFGHKPFIEFGFMPRDLVDQSFLIPQGNVWDDFNQYKEKGWACPPKDFDRWHDLIVRLMEHLVERYGADEVSTWLFELWNEPNLTYWRGTMAQYCKLFDYTEHAVHSVLPAARLSGPAVTELFEEGTARQFFEKFLQHCKSGVNYYTGHSGTQLDFVTFHVKGGSFPFDLDPEKDAPSVKRLTYQVKLGLECIKNAGFAGKDVVLSEADPDGWAAGGIYDNRNMNFRNTEYYASYVASAYDKIQRLAQQYQCSVSPLAWAFLFPGERCFEGTRTFVTQGIDKPILNLFKMYGKLGYDQLAFTSDSAQQIVPPKEPLEPQEKIDPPETPADIGGFATRGPHGETQILIYSHHDDPDGNRQTPVELCVQGYHDQTGLQVRHYRIDQSHSNAYTEWLQAGKPLYPQESDYAQIKRRDDLELLEPCTVLDSADNRLVLHFSMPEHAVSLIEISPCQQAPSGVS